jgi:hypothetical protein
MGSTTLFILRQTNPPHPIESIGISQGLVVAPREGGYNSSRNNFPITLTKSGVRQGNKSFLRER